MIRYDLKVTSFIFDALNSFVTQSVLAADNSAVNDTTTNNNGETEEMIIIIFFGFLYFVVSLVQLILTVYFQHLRQGSSKDSFSKRMKRCYKDCNVAMMIGLNLLLLVSTWLCFIGDNLHSFGSLTEEKRIASVVILFAALTGFRLIPLLKDEIKKIREGESDSNNQSETNNNNILTETNNSGVTPDKPQNKCLKLIKNVYRRINWNLFCLTIDMLQLVPEIDGWFTNFTTLVALTNRSSCTGAYKAALWIMYSIIIVLVATLPVFAIIQCRKQKKKNAEENSESSKSESRRESQAEPQSRQILKTLKFKIAITVVMFIIVVLFLIGDNNQPLDCSFRCDIYNCKKHNITRSVFIAISFILYIFMLILAAFGFRHKVAPVNKGADTDKKK